MQTLKLIPILLSIVFLGGCNPLKSTAEAEKAAVLFHTLYDDEDYDKIFDTAHADFKSAQPKVDTINFLKSVREQLGTIKTTNRTGWKANSFNLKTNVVLTYETEYQNGRGVETFTYRIANGGATLLGWHITSNDVVFPGTAAAPESKSDNQDSKREPEPLP